MLVTVPENNKRKKNYVTLRIVADKKNEYQVKKIFVQILTN